MSRLDDLYARYLTPLTRKLVGFGQTEQDAEDVAQETLIATSKRLDHVTPEGEWFYLLRSAFNNARKREVRAAAPRHGGGHVTALQADTDAIDEDSLSAEEVLIRDEEIARFRARFDAAMAELSEDTRQCVVLRKRGYGSREIADLLDLTDQAVRTRLSRAFVLIRERVGEPPAGVPWMDLLGDDDDHQT